EVEQRLGCPGGVRRTGRGGLSCPGCRAVRQAAALDRHRARRRLDRERTRDRIDPRRRQGVAGRAELQRVDFLARRTRRTGQADRRTAAALPAGSGRLIFRERAKALRGRAGGEAAFLTAMSLLAARWQPRGGFATNVFAPSRLRSTQSMLVALFK